MSMTVYTAHVFVKSEDKDAYFELSFDNEMNPELAIKDNVDTFINDFSGKGNREDLVSKAFDANYLWEDSNPYYLSDEVDSASDFNTSISREYREFCKTINEMNNVKYVVFAVDSDRQDWMGYASYWYDAFVFDFGKHCLYKIEWRGDAEDEKPFNKSVVKKLVELIDTGNSEQIDIGSFMVNGKPMGNVTAKELKETNNTDIKSESPDKKNADSPEAEQIERIGSLIKRVDNLDFKDKTFVFDYLDYVPVNGVYCGPDDPDHPIVKRVLDAGGLMRKSVSGKTDFLVVNTSAGSPRAGAKSRATLNLIDKGKDINIITLDNLLELLDKQ